MFTQKTETKPHDFADDEQTPLNFRWIKKITDIKP